MSGIPRRVIYLWLFQDEESSTMTRLSSTRPRRRTSRLRFRAPSTAAPGRASRRWRVRLESRRLLSRASAGLAGELPEQPLAVRPNDVFKRERELGHRFFVGLDAHLDHL